MAAIRKLIAAAAIVGAIAVIPLSGISVDASAGRLQINGQGNWPLGQGNWPL